MQSGQRSVSGRGIDRFFNNLGAKVAKIADREVDRMAESLVYALKHRQYLKGGNGQYPQWSQNTFNVRETKSSKNSFREWKKRINGKRDWIIYNDATDPTTGYNYPRNLITGKGWPKKVKYAVANGGGHTERLVSKGDKIFSKQLPNGLNPWLVIKRKELKRNIQKAIK